MAYQSEQGNFTIALAGDTMLTRKLTPFTEERFLRLREILRGADARFANLEGTVHTWDEGTPGITQGTFMTTDPKLLEDLQWLGINLVSCANNHAFDYGEDGVLANLKHLDVAGMVHAGTGKNLAEARAPGYLDTPNGRVALVATTATFRPWNQAGEQRPDLRGRPGINPLGLPDRLLRRRRGLRTIASASAANSALKKAPSGRANIFIATRNSPTPTPPS